MSISAAEAAKLTGLSKQAVINSIKSGKISAVKEVDGRWSIEPVELFRHYQPVSSINGNGHQELDAAIQPIDTSSVDGLRVEVKLLREVLEAKDDVISAKDDTIMDLRARLNVEQEERRRLSMMITAGQTPPAPQLRSWWSRLLGGA